MLSRSGDLKVNEMMTIATAVIGRFYESVSKGISAAYAVNRCFGAYTSSRLAEDSTIQLLGTNIHPEAPPPYVLVGKCASDKRPSYRSKARRRSNQTSVDGTSVQWDRMGDNYESPGEYTCTTKTSDGSSEDECGRIRCHSAYEGAYCENANGSDEGAFDREGGK